MNQYRVSGDARKDLDEIWSSIAEDNPEAADKFIHLLLARFSTLASMPDMGWLREELSPDLRGFPVGMGPGIFHRCSNESAYAIPPRHSR